MAIYFLAQKPDKLNCLTAPFHRQQPAEGPAVLAADLINEATSGRPAPLPAIPLRRRRRAGEPLDPTGRVDGIVYVRCW
jgi:hypothetical protein